MKKEFIKLGKSYLYLGILGSFVFFMIKPLSPENMVMDNNLVEIAKRSVQSIITNQNIKQIGMLFLLLYTSFVAIESLIVIRDWVGRLYYKGKGNTEQN